MQPIYIYGAVHKLRNTLWRERVTIALQIVTEGKGGGWVDRAVTEHECVCFERSFLGIF